MFSKLREKVRCVNLRETQFSLLVVEDINKKIQNGYTIFFFVTPEKLLHLYAFQNFFKNVNVRKAIIYDEAHSIPKWGIDFRPTLISSHGWLQGVPNLQTIIASATISLIDINFIQAVFDTKIPQAITLLEPRRNISYRVIEISSISQFNSIHRFVRIGDIAAIINILFPTTKHLVVFLESRKGVRHLAEKAIEGGISAGFIESGTADASKEYRLSMWNRGEIDVLFGTSAISLGINNKQCEGVLHIGYPHSIYTFLQESGRCGRANQPAICVILVDKSHDYNMICRKTEKEERLKIATLVSTGNNAFVGWFVFVQRRSCVQSLMLFFIGKRTDSIDCGNCTAYHLQNFRSPINRLIG